MFNRDDYDKCDDDISFEDLIKKYDMSPLVHISVDEEGVLVSEKWSSDENLFITSERYYYFDISLGIYYMEYLPYNVKMKALREILEIYVEMELFEFAVVVRDELNYNCK